MSLPIRASFHPQHPALQIAWDSTSLGLGEECWTKYYYQIILGFRPKGAGVHLKFGEIVHYGLEVYFKARALNASHEIAQQQAVGYCLTKYYTWRSEDTTKNLWNALRAIVWHTENKKDSSSRTLMIGETPAIELPFKYSLGISAEGQELLYCGHMDQVVEDPAGIWVRDHKTTKAQLDAKYFSNYNPDTQLPGYLIASEVVLHQPIMGVKINAIQTGVHFCRSAEGAIILGEAQKDEWMKDTQWHIRQATVIFKDFDPADLLRVPRNRKSCFGCQYRPICSVPPSLRLGLLASHYERAFWDPLVRKESL